MDQELVVLVSRRDQLDEKAAEISDRGLTIMGKMVSAAILKVHGDPLKLQGMTGIQIRKAEIMKGLEE